MIKPFLFSLTYFLDLNPLCINSCYIALHIGGLSYIKDSLGCFSKYSNLLCHENKRVFSIILWGKNARYTLSNTHKDAKIDGQSVVIAAATDYQLPPAASDPQESAGGSRSALQKTVGVFKKTAKKTRDFGLKHRPEFTFEAKFPIFGGKNQKPECNLIVEKKV
ncbi:uncharacterized protein [Elaeis guineensis]|uniref:uncharacterized protein isoform X1 n=1 Tax=Elaeis guineensis var. tenera TaxID=51953 RepID=UPI003C6CE617